MLLSSGALAAAQIERLAVSRADGQYHLTLHARIDAPADAVWATLIDYANLRRLSKAVQLSEVVGRDSDGRPWVRTVSHVCVWVFCRDIALVQRMRERAPGVLEADNIAEQSDFDQGFTRWLITPDGAASRFEFVADMHPAFWVPPLLGPYLIMQGLRDSALDALAGLERMARMRAR